MLAHFLTAFEIDNDPILMRQYSHNHNRCNLEDRLLQSKKEKEKEITLDY